MINSANQGCVECWRCPRSVAGVTLKQWVGSPSSLNSSQSLKITITLRGGRRNSTTAQQHNSVAGMLVLGASIANTVTLTHSSLQSRT